MQYVFLNKLTLLDEFYVHLEVFWDLSEPEGFQIWAHIFGPVKTSTPSCSELID